MLQVIERFKIAMIELTLVHGMATGAIAVFEPGPGFYFAKVDDLRMGRQEKGQEGRTAMGVAQNKDHGNGGQGGMVLRISWHGCGH